MVDASAVAGVTKSIASALVTEAQYLYEVEDQIQALQRELECMHEFLVKVDANPNQLKQDGQLRILTHRMRELAFRAEDAIDTYLVDVRSKIDKKSFVKKILCIASHSYPIYMLRKDIEGILHETKEDMLRAERFHLSIPTTCLSEGVRVGSSSSNPASEDYVHLDDEFVVGIADDITKLVERLIDPEDDFKVLGIVGIGGGGKTTLASKIYQHKKVKSSFPIRAYVSISQQWNRLDLLRRIYKEVIGDFQISASETELVRQLHDHLMGKQCLVVLDDIWKKEAWDDIYPILPHTRGFRAILTTRIEEVPLYADKKCVLHEPKLLTEEQVWSLFSKGAVEGRHDIENNVEFEKLGKVMLQKCHGLPLAVVTLAGILRTKQHLYEWQRISVACLDSILIEKGGSTYGVVEEMLQLSYLDLPTYLKPLFLYLSIIPEDKIFFSEELIQMWIAEGFIADDQQMRYGSLEDKAMWFLGELAQRYIFQVVSRDHQNQVESIRLHDLMREFCIKKAMECQFFENITPTCLYGAKSSKSRRLSIFSREYCLEENHHTRSMVYDSLSSSLSVDFYGTIRNLESIHKQFKLLRVLSIKGCANKALPKEIGNLVHLTYFSLVDTQIFELPQSIRNLRNLLYFEFDPGLAIAALPNDLVGSMENLRVLILPGRLKRGSSKCNNRLGLSSQRHKKMHTLSCGAGAWLTKAQIDFPTTIRELRLRNIEETEEMEAVYGCLSFLKDTLHSFECVFGRSTNKNSILFDMEKLREHAKLRTLFLWGPLLLSDNYILQFPPNLVRISLCYSKIKKGFDPMEVLGLLSELKSLTIRGDFYMGTQLNCAGTAFPKLQELQIVGLKNIQEWRLEGRAMGCLKKIHVSDCPNLKRLPERIISITTLKHLEICYMPKEFCARLGYEEDKHGESTNTVGFGEDAYIIQHIPTVIFGPWAWSFLAS